MPRTIKILWENTKTDKASKHMLIFHSQGIAAIPYLPTKEKEYKMKSLVSFWAILMLCSCGLRTYDNRTTFAKILDEPEDYVDEIVVIETPIQERN